MGKLCFHFLYWRTCKDCFFFINHVNGSIFSYGYKFPSVVCLWKYYLNTNFQLIFLSKSWKLNLKKFHVFYLVEKLTCRKRKPTDRGADFLSFEDLHPLFHWQVSVGRCSAGNLEVSAYTGTATLRLVKTQGLPLGSNEEIWVYWFNSNTTEW